MEPKTYEDGLRDGQIKAIESILHSHKERLEQHEHRLKQQERVSWILIGAFGLVQFLPALQGFLGK
jgi:hypothetical protein